MGSEHPHKTEELCRDSPKVNMWCGITFERTIGPFFFNEATITADVYHDLLTEYLEPQLNDLQPTVIFQQDIAPPHWGRHVRQFLNQKFSERWIVVEGGKPPLSPDKTSLDFFYGVT